MTTIDPKNLTDVNGGVRDSGDGQGCIPSPFPRPQPRPLPGGDGDGDIRRPILGTGWPTAGQ